MGLLSITTRARAVLNGTCEMPQTDDTLAVYGSYTSLNSLMIALTHNHPVS